MSRSEEDGPGSRPSVGVLHDHVVGELLPKHLPDAAEQIVPEDPVVLIELAFHRDDALLIVYPLQLLDYTDDPCCSEPGSTFGDYVADLSHNFSLRRSSAGNLG